MTPLAALALAGCLAVPAEADRITLGDLAPALSAVETGATGTPVSYAPAPGVRRVFGVAELGRLAARFHLAAGPARAICFERPVAPPEPARLLAAMRRTLPEGRIEILDYSRLPVPEGPVEFALSGLRPGPAGGFWSGWVRYAGSRRFPLWARVKVLVRSARVVAAADLQQGCLLEAAQLRLVEIEELPAPQDARGARFAASLEQLVGKVLRRAVRAGTPLGAAWLEAAKEVNRGDRVRVEVRSGGARLEVEGVAEAAGVAGEAIPVRNPESKRSFRARVEGKRKVSVTL